MLEVTHVADDAHTIETSDAPPMRYGNAAKAPCPVCGVYIGVVIAPTRLIVGETIDPFIFALRRIFEEGLAAVQERQQQEEHERRLPSS